MTMDWYDKHKVDEKLGGKQDTLISGSNIKTINGQDITGAGNIYVAGGPVDDIRGADGSSLITARIARVNKTAVGLSQVDNTSDLNKPISTATQTALTTETTARSTKDTDLQNQINATNVEVAKKVDKVSSAWQLYATNGSGVQTTVTYSEAASGGSVAKRDGASRLRVGTPTDSNNATTKKYVDDADNAITANLNTHVANTNNPHTVTKEQVGLGNVDNTADAYKPISNAQEIEFNARVKYTDIVNDCTSADTNKPLSAKQGKLLQDQITDLYSRGRYLSNWDSTLGLPETNPSSMPYTYKTGDYYIVSIVGTTNYKPYGLVYDGTPSATPETEEINPNDTYTFDGTTWTLLKAIQRALPFGAITGEARTNTSLLSEFTVIDNHRSATNNPHNTSFGNLTGNVRDNADLATEFDNTTCLDNSTLERNDNKIRVKENGLEVRHLKSTAVSTSIPSSGAVDTKVATEKAVANVTALDDITIERDSNVVRVKEEGLEVRHLKTDAVSAVIPATGAVDTKVTTEKAVADALNALPVVDDTTIEVNANNKYQIKDAGVSLAKFETQATTEADKVYTIESDGTTTIKSPKVHKDVTTFTGETGDERILYYLTADDGTYTKGLYIYNGTDFVSVSPYLPLAGGEMTGTLAVKSGANSIVGTDDTATIEFDAAVNGGAGLTLTGKDNATDAGSFDLFASDNTTSVHLKGETDGSLKWNNEALLTGGNLKQVIIDTLYPVGARYIQLEGMPDPNTIGGTWSLDSNYNNRTLWCANSSTLGTKKSAGLPDIQGVYVLMAMYDGSTRMSLVSNPSGAFSRDESTTKWQAARLYSTSTSVTGPTIMNFKASGSNSIYGNSTTVQPPAVTCKVWKRTA